MIKQFFLGVLFGAMIILYFSQFDPWVHLRLEYVLKQVLTQTFECHVGGSVENLSLFPPVISIKNLSFSSRNNAMADWYWLVEKYTTGFSWLNALGTGSVRMWSVMENVSAYSAISKGKLSILPHIKSLIKGPDFCIPVSLTSIEMRRASLVVNNGLCNQFYWNGESWRQQDVFYTKWYVYDGSIKTESVVLLQNIKGTVLFEASESNNILSTSIRVDGWGESPQLSEYPLCFVTGRWLNDRGRFQIHNTDYSLRINPLILFERETCFYMDASLVVPLSYIAQLGFLHDQKIKGVAHIQARGDISLEGNGESYFMCEEITWDQLITDAILRGSVFKKGMEVNGVWDMKANADYAWHGSFSWDGKKEAGFCDIFNTVAIPLSVFSKAALLDDLKLHVTYDKQKHLFNGIFSCRALHDNQPFEIKANGSLDKNKYMHSEAFLGEYHCVINGWNYDIPRIDTLTLSDHSDSVLLQCQSKEHTDYYTGSIDLAFLRHLGSELFHYDVHSEGMLLFDVQLKNKCLYTEIQSRNATIRLPQTLNFIHNCTALIKIDIPAYKIVINNGLMRLHTGTLHIPTATIQLDKQGQLQFLHIPLTVDRCLFTMKHDLFAVVSGSLLFQKHAYENFQLTGNLIFDRSQCKENLFSGSVQKKLFNSSDWLKSAALMPLYCDIRLETKEPIRIDTPFLEANAHVHLKLYDNIIQPSVSGVVSIPSGAIKFPYKPLHLTKGEITFLPEQPFNPLVEIIAKNTIKNHKVVLSVTGSLQDNLVMLESTPPLTEEQIVGLLIAGAHEESLQAIVPALLMQNMTNYIFSSHRVNFFDRYIKPWMKQINMHLTPHFSDPSGRGGLRGALEITINDRWRALIEKNFSLTESTRFELEYILSDDVSFRVTRDERYDIGAEVEMRWKF